MLQMREKDILKNARAIDEYIAQKKEEGSAESTCIAYRRHVRRFLEGVGKGFDNVTPEDAIAWFRIRTESDGMRPSTIKTEVRNAFGFYKWCEEDGRITENPIDAVIKDRQNEGQRFESVLEKIVHKRGTSYRKLSMACGVRVTDFSEMLENMATMPIGMVDEIANFLRCSREEHELLWDLYIKEGFRHVRYGTH